MKKEKLTFSLGGIAVGLINGLLGSGGGMIAVPLLRKKGFDQRTAQSNAIAIILPVSLVSIVFYLIKGNLPVLDTAPFAVTGAVGTLLGTFLLKKISNKWLSVIFSLFMVYAGVRLLFK